MTSFGWKRKVPLTRTTTKSSVFNESDQTDPEAVDDNEEFDWTVVAKKKKLEALEDNKALFSRLKQEGILLAESGKFWQAINRWDNALSIDATGIWRQKLSSYSPQSTCLSVLLICLDSSSCPLPSASYHD